MNPVHKSNHSKNWKLKSFFKTKLENDKKAELTMLWCGEDVKDFPNYSRRWKNVTCEECKFVREADRAEAVQLSEPIES